MLSQSLEAIVERYDGKVARLLCLGREILDHRWDKFFYASEFGFDESDVAQLMRLASDKELYNYNFNEDDEALEFFGVIHAWRALSELGASEAKTLFQELLEESDNYIENDWIFDMFEKLIAPYRSNMWGEATSIILDENRNEWVRVSYFSLLKDMMENNEIERGELNAFLTRFFADSEHQIVNASAISLCLEFGLTEQYDAIARCYANDWVDLYRNGDLEDVEIAFGMRTERETKRRMSPFFEALMENMDKPTRQIPDKTTLREPKLGRNDPCPCGSGKKYKKCCLDKDPFKQ